MREYRCTRCGKSVIEDRGAALWQILHDANQEQEAQPRAAGSDAAQRTDGSASGAPKTRRWWMFWIR